MVAVTELQPYDSGFAGRDPAAQLSLLGADNLVVVDVVNRQAPNAPGQRVEWVDRITAIHGG